MSDKPELTPESKPRLNSIELMKNKQNADSVQTENVSVFPALSKQLNKVDCYQKSQTEKSELPVSLNHRYFSVQNKFYFRSPPQSLAFTDKGIKLQTRFTNSKVVTDLLTIASNRQWTEIRLSGCQAFKREAWFQAKLQGVHVSGYRPTEADLKRLSQLQETASKSEYQCSKTKNVADIAKEIGQHLPKQSRQKFLDKVMQKFGLKPKHIHDKTNPKIREQQHELER